MKMKSRRIERVEERVEELRPFPGISKKFVKRFSGPDPDSVDLKRVCSTCILGRFLCHVNSNKVTSHVVGDSEMKARCW